MKKYLENLIIPDYIKRIKIDVGLSYNAPVSQMLLERDDDVFIFGFEPNPESIECIVNKTRTYGASVRLDRKYIDENRIKILPIALGNTETEGVVDFYVAEEDPGCSSLHPPIDLRITSRRTIKVPIFSLKHFFDTFDWNRFKYIEWLKIDAQGSDLNILIGAGDYLKERVVYVTAEADGRQYADCDSCNTENIVDYMNSQGFVQVSHPNTVDPTFLNPKFDHLKDSIYIKQ